MSRAFVKELDDVLPAEPAVQRPQSRPMTARGLAAFRERLAASVDDSERRVLEDRIAAAVVVGPPSNRSAVAFGAAVTVSGADRAERTFTIVGEDEIDIESGKIGAASPLGHALLGARVGDVVVWERPAGATRLTVRAIAYSD